MHDSAMIDYITATFPDVETSTALGYTFFFYKSERKLPFATLIAADTECDRISNLDRPGAYRLNIGISKQTFESLFGTGKVDVKNYDFTALDVILPHPEYADYHFVCVLSPGQATWEQARVLLAEAYDIALRRYTRQHENG